jgi:hypothetical protein
MLCFVSEASWKCDIVQLSEVEIKKVGGDRCQSVREKILYSCLGEDIFCRK